MTPAAAAKYLRVEVNAIVQEMNQNAQSRARRGVNLLRNAALEVLGQDGSGRRYGRHIASAPGQPPAPDKGNLRRNWRQAVIGYPNGKGLGITIKMQITSDVKYAMFLEKGTRKMAARPFKERIKTKARPPIEALFASI